MTAAAAAVIAAIGALSLAPSRPDGGADAGKKEVPALPPEQARLTGTVKQDFVPFNDFAYEWTSPAGKVALEFVKAELEEGEAAGLYVTGIVDGARKAVVYFRDVNAGARTRMLVKPITKRHALGVAIVSDRGDGSRADRAVEIRWDGKQFLVKESAGAWAR